MKVKTKYRYIIWTESGQAHSTTTNKMNRTPRSWTPEIGVPSVDSHREPQLDDCCPGDWGERVYDTHDEEDAKLIDLVRNLIDNPSPESFKREIKKLSECFYSVEWRQFGNLPKYRCFAYKPPGRPFHVPRLTAHLALIPWIEGIHGRTFFIPDEIDELFELIDAFALL